MITLNSDLGESFGAWKMGADQVLMPIIDMANIACGFHAGDPDVMQQTIALAKMYNVTVGAHPSYDDKQGFGRRHISCSDQQIENLVTYQISALIGMAAAQGVDVCYVKPHGALYNDMMKDADIRFSIYRALRLINQTHQTPLKLMMLSSSDNEIYAQEASAFQLSLLFEGFIDRLYKDDGSLVSRNISGSVLNSEQMLEQANNIIQHQMVVTESGQRLPLKCDTLCVHGDTELNPDVIREIKALCQQ